MMDTQPMRLDAKTFQEMLRKRPSLFLQRLLPVCICRPGAPGYWLPKNEATPEKSGAKRGCKEETPPFSHVRNSNVPSTVSAVWTDTSLSVCTCFKVGLLSFANTRFLAYTIRIILILSILLSVLTLCVLV